MGRGRHLLPALLLAGAALLGAPARGQSAPARPTGVPERARAILADPRYQTRLPEHEAPQDLDESRPRPSSGGVSLPAAAAPVISAGAELTRIVFLVLLVAVIALVLAWVVRAVAERLGRARAGGEGEVQGTGAAAGPEREPDLEDATRLAAEGRYGEAIHALLLAAIHHFAARAHMTVQPSRTSRELARLLPLRSESRTAFDELVRAVERTLFGGEAAGPEDYQRSLERFRSLVRRPA
ncbi:MAG: DUF4129 domain-containing protein [Acidobacteria bacterium]|nr:DUF4129 domain-containing protein [Acidobacteriota bacterium]